MDGFFVTLPSWAWALAGVFAGACVLSILDILSCAARNEIQVHRLRVDAATLRINYMKRILERQTLEVDEAADELPPAAPSMKQAA